MQGSAANSTRRRRAWAKAIAEAGILWGADRSDRFQGAAPLEGGHHAPRLTASGGVVGDDEAGEHIKLMMAWSGEHVARAGWPGRDAYLYFDRWKAGLVSTGLIAGGVELGWVFWPRRLDQVPGGLWDSACMSRRAVSLDCLSALRGIRVTPRHALVAVFLILMSS